MTVIPKNTLTIIVTAHDEGELSYLSLESVFCAAKELNKIGVEYDVLINIDKGNRETIDYFEGIKTDKMTINYSNYGDPGLARNDAISRARGEYLALIDADDAISKNWLVESMKIVTKNKELILTHPEAELRYSQKGFVSLDIRTNLNNLWEETLALILGNRWCSIVVGKRSVFLNNPYSASNNGFGYEDYYFNCSTVYDSVEQVVVPKTTAFCLQKERGVTKRTHKNNEVLPYLKLFDYRYLQKKMKSNGLPQYSYGREECKIPSFVLPQFQEFCTNKIELRKMSEDIRRTVINKNDAYECVMIGELFCKMISKLKINNSRTLFFVNNLVDYYESRSGKNDIIIFLGDYNNLPSGNNVLDFQCFFGKAPFWIKEAIMIKLLIEFGIRRIIVCENDFVSELIKKYDYFITENNIEIKGVI